VTPKSYRSIKQVRVRWYDEGGNHVANKMAPLYLDTKGTPTFVMVLPPHVVKALGLPNEGRIESAKAEDVQPIFDRRMKEFHEWHKTATATPVIIVKAKYMGWADEDRIVKKDSFFIDSEMSGSRAENTRAVGLAYELAFKVNGQVHERERQWYDKDHNRLEAPIFVVGYQKGHVDGVVLDYTPELHARIDAILAAINRAVLAIDEIVESKDPAKAFLTGPGTKLIASPKRAIDDGTEKR
jgi:hypothetical protein